MEPTGSVPTTKGFSISEIGRASKYLKDRHDLERVQLRLDMPDASMPVCTRPSSYLNIADHSCST